MSAPSSGTLSTPTFYGKVDFGPSFGQVFRPLNSKRIVVEAGDVTIQPFDNIVIIAQGSASFYWELEDGSGFWELEDGSGYWLIETPAPAAFNCLLPDLALWMAQPYGGFDLIIKNQNLGFDGTLIPFGAQKIDGLSSIILASSGSITLSPLNDLSGWITL